VQERTDDEELATRVELLLSEFLNNVVEHDEETHTRVQSGILVVVKMSRRIRFWQRFWIGSPGQRRINCNSYARGRLGSSGALQSNADQLRPRPGDHQDDCRQHHAQAF